MHNVVQGAFKRRNMLNGKEISLNFLQNRRIIAIFVCLGLFLRRAAHALRSSRIMQLKQRSNIEISEAGEK